MKKIFTYLSIVMFCGAIVVGCESQLDIQKHGNMGTLEGFYETDEDAEQAAAAMYIGINSAYFNWYMTLNLLSDDSITGGSGRGDQTAMEDVNEYNYASDNTRTSNVYKYLYTAIYYTNLVLDNLASDTSVKQRVIAEAHFLRAWCHFQLVTLWGTAPIVDHVLTTAEYKQPNGTAAGTWAFIEEDLNTAINSGWLPSKTSVDDEETTCRITKEVAQALLGKSYLFQGKYTDAASMLDNVINSGLYALYEGPYEDIMHTPFNNCCESMFELQKRNDTNMNLASSIWAYCGWRVDQWVMEYGYTYYAPATYGFCHPREDLYNAFVEMEGVDGYRLNQVIVTYEQLAELGMTIDTGNYIYGAEGYEFWKMRASTDDQIAQGEEGRQWTDCPIMRYAEVLALAAEAQLQSGNSAKAMEYLNQIRRRAQLPDLTSITLDDIKKEKRLEFCMETIRYQDLIRWGDAETVLAEQGHYIYQTSYEDGEVVVSLAYTNTQYGFKSKHKLLPFPATEMQVNENMVQNEGW